MDSLDGDVSCGSRMAVGKLNGAPQPIELLALVHVHHPVDWRGPHPQVPVLHEYVTHSAEDHLEHAEGPAESLLGEQVAVPGVGQLLVGPVFGDHGHQVEGSIELVHVLHDCLRTLVLCGPHMRREEELMLHNVIQD